MKDYISNFVFDFLRELEINNNREWFNTNKKRYEAARTDFLEFIDGLLPEIYKIDPSIGIQKAENCMYRIYRDIRFSPDKTPYKTHFAVYIATGGIKQHGRPGYYIHIQPDNSSIGGGIFMPNPQLLNEIRNEIFYNIDNFKAILNEPSFKKYYPELWDFEKLKRAPKGFPNNWPDADFLKHKHYVSSLSIDNETVTSEGFHNFVLERVKATAPLNQFINNVMYGLLNQ